MGFFLWEVSLFFVFVLVFFCLLLVCFVLSFQFVRGKKKFLFFFICYYFYLIMLMGHFYRWGIGFLRPCPDYYYWLQVVYGPIHYEGLFYFDMKRWVKKHFFYKDLTGILGYCIYFGFLYCQRQVTVNYIRNGPFIVVEGCFFFLSICWIIDWAILYMAWCFTFEYGSLTVDIWKMKVFTIWDFFFNDVALSGRDCF
jgi:hypothetical protein